MSSTPSLANATKSSQSISVVSSGPADGLTRTLDATTIGNVNAASTINLAEPAASVPSGADTSDSATDDPNTADSVTSSATVSVPKSACGAGQLSAAPALNSPDSAVENAPLRVLPLRELSSNELVVLCQRQPRQESAAFQELILRYQSYVDQRLYHLASDWSDRSDLAQEVWIRVFRSLHNLKDPNKFKGWLARITTNLFYDELRKRKRFQGSVSLDAPRMNDDGQFSWELPSDAPTPNDVMMTQEFQEHLKHAMAELPEIFQDSIAMREIQDLSYDEIAKLTGVSLGTVKSRIARARQRLQQKLLVYMEGEGAAKS